MKPYTTAKPSEALEVMDRMFNRGLSRPPHGFIFDHEDFHTPLDIQLSPEFKAAFERHNGNLG